MQAIWHRICERLTRKPFVDVIKFNYFVKEVKAVKKIEAIVRLTKIADVCAALEKAGYPEFITTEIECHGKQKGIKQQVRDRTYKIGLKTRAKIEVLVKDDDAEKIVNTIQETAFTGEIYDSKIVILSVDDIVRICTG
jgi:nitrogen regulatory protein P-II 1